MPRLQFTIAKQMAVVVVIAIDLALFAILVRSHVLLLVGITLSGLILQVLGAVLIDRREQARGFWLGFAVGLLLAMASYGWADCTAPQITITPGGKAVFSPGSRLWILWSQYFHFASNRLDPWIEKIPGITNEGALAFVVASLILSAPQFVVACFFGQLGKALTILGAKGVAHPIAPPPSPQGVGNS